MSYTINTPLGLLLVHDDGTQEYLSGGASRSDTNTVDPSILYAGSSSPLDFSAAMAYANVLAHIAGNPTTTPSTGSVSARTINRAARSTEKTQQTVAGANSLIPLVYGTQRVGGKISAMLVDQGNLILRSTWCLGEIDSFVNVQIDDAAPESGIVVTNYTGTQTQGIDATLQAAFNRAGKTYTDTLRGIAYSVFKIPPAKSRGFPRLSATIKGMKVRWPDPTSARSYSDNAAYIIADFIEDTRYGMGRAVDWPIVGELALACDETVGGERKRILNLVLGSSDTGEGWLQTLRAYADCWIVPEGGVYRLVPDVPGTAVAAYDAGSIVEKTLKLQKKELLNQETVVQVEYTDTTQTPWATLIATAYAPGVDDGTTPFRLSRVAMPGITRYSEANRVAIERLNEALLCDLSANFVTYDEALGVRVGDLIAITHPVGVSSKEMRVLQMAPVEPGRWRISATEYDPAKYSSIVVSGPSRADTTLPSPLKPPTPTGLVLAEDVYQDNSGLFGSRIRATWDALDATFPYIDAVVVTITQSGIVKDSAVVASGTTYLSKALTENLPYVVAVAVRSTTGAIGVAATATIINSGKSAKPTDVPSITGSEVGGEVRLAWVPATDFDLTAHEIRYSTTGGSWATATLLDRVATPGVRYTTKIIAPGTWRFWIKGLDSVRSVAYPYGQESVNAAFIDVTVTSDANAFIAAYYQYTGGTVTNMAGLVEAWSGVNYLVSDNGATWSATFTSNLSTYTNPLWTYPGGFTNGYESEHKDFGASLTGLWNSRTWPINIAGTADSYLDLSPDDSTYTAGALSRSATARYAKLRVTSTGTLLLRSNVWDVNVVIVGRSETGSVTTNAAGGGAKTVSLTGKYVKAVSIQLTPASGNAARFATYDNVVVSLSGANSFDAWAFDAAGVQQSVALTYTFQGV